MAKKPLDLSIRPLCPPGQRFPNFRNQNRTVFSQTSAGAAVLDLFKPNAACTVQWVMVQTSAACMLQLYLNGAPFGAQISVAAGTIVFFPGTLLVNDEKLSLSVGAATVLTYEVVWIKDHYADAVNQNVVFSNVSPASTVQPVQLYKQTFIETTTPLAANGVFTGPWHDSEASGAGATYVTATMFSNAAGANNGLIIQESDDITNANLTRTFAQQGGAINANSLIRVAGYCRARFWRVQLTNGAGAQGTLEITTTAAINTALPNVVGTPETGIPVSIGLSAGNGAVADNNLFTTSIPNNAVAQNPAASAMFYWGGRFSGTANAALQGWSAGRTATIFKLLSSAAAGPTAIWTPGTGNKFRLLKYRIVVTASAILAAAADVTISLLDAALDIGQDYIVRVPAAALGSGVNFDSGVCDLGRFGILSAVANNALNLTLSSALTGGKVNVYAWGTEE